MHLGYLNGSQYHVIYMDIPFFKIERYLLRGVGIQSSEQRVLSWKLKTVAIGSLRPYIHIMLVVARQVN